MSRPVIVPLGVEGPELPVGPQPGVRMEDVPGKPATILGLSLRCVQFGCAAITLAIMISIDFMTVPSFRLVFFLFPKHYAAFYMPITICIFQSFYFILTYLPDSFPMKKLYITVTLSLPIIRDL
jgi:hypothetical protein